MINKNKMHVIPSGEKDLRDISDKEEIFEEKVKEEQTYLSTFTTTNWHKYNLAKTQEKRFFYELLNELCQIITEPIHENGRPPIPIKDLFFMTSLKVYSNYSSRKIDYDLKMAESVGYVKRAPHFNRLSEFLNCPATYELLQRLLTITAMPLKNLEDDYSMDASGFGSYQYERWQRARIKNKRGWRNYVKGHIVIGTRTNVICSAEITHGNFSDAGQAPKLLETLGNNFEPKQVSADKGYSSYRIHQIIKGLGAMPFIAFKVNSKDTKQSPEIWKRMYRYFKNHRQEFLKCYHRRSNVETTFSMIKVRLGEFLKSKNHEAQRNEVMMKFIIHNICCLVTQIFYNDVHIDFRQCMKKYIAPKN